MTKNIGHVCQLTFGEMETRLQLNVGFLDFVNTFLKRHISRKTVSFDTHTIQISFSYLPVNVNKD